MKKEQLLALRLVRQGLAQPTGSMEYDALFRRLSPVLPIYWCCPGQPPSLPGRVDFDDGAYCFGKRGKREIIKGRFQNGNIAYILADELPLFAAAYRKEGTLSFEAEALLGLLAREGPMNIGLMKESTGLLVKQITPLLHRLQCQFLLFEDQQDNEWDRPWFLMREVFPDLEQELKQWTRQTAVQALLLRFAGAMVAFDIRQACDFYHFPLKEVRQALATLTQAGKLLETEAGYLLPADRDLLEQGSGDPAPSVFVLHRNDFLVKAEESKLKEHWKRDGLDTLYYILVDGEIRGAVFGKFHNGPFEVEDIRLELPPAQAEARKQEVLQALDRVCPSTQSPARNYMGKSL